MPSPRKVKGTHALSTLNGQGPQCQVSNAVSPSQQARRPDQLYKMPSVCTWLQPKPRQVVRRENAALTEKKPELRSQNSIREMTGEQKVDYISHLQNDLIDMDQQIRELQARILQVRDHISES